MGKSLWIMLALLFSAIGPPAARANDSVVTLNVSGSLLVFSSRVSANPATYTYTGNPFNEFINGLACPPDCAISGSFTVASPIGDNFNGGITPSMFSFTDGNVTLSSAVGASIVGSGEPVGMIFVQTDASGAIVDWNIGVCSVPFSSNHVCLGSVELFTGGPSNPGDSVFIGAGSGSNAGVPGTWMSSVAVTPEPNSGVLWLLGVALMFVMRKRIGQRLSRAS